MILQVRALAALLTAALVMTQLNVASAKARVIVVYPIRSTSDLRVLAHNLTEQVASRIERVDGFDAKIEHRSGDLADSAAADGAEIYIAGQITALTLGVHLTLAAISVTTNKVVATQTFDLLEPRLPDSMDINPLVGMTANPRTPQSSATVATDPMTVLVPMGTEVDLAVDSTISSGNAKVDDTFSLHALHDVIIGDKIVIAKGAHGQGEVTDVEPAGSNGHPGKITLQYDWIDSVDGLQIPLSDTQQQSNGDDKRGAASTATIASYVVLGALGLFAHNFVRGSDITIQPTTKLVCYTGRNMHIAPRVDDAPTTSVGYAR